MKREEANNNKDEKLLGKKLKSNHSNNRNNDYHPSDNNNNKNKSNYKSDKSKDYQYNHSRPNNQYNRNQHPHFRNHFPNHNKSFHNDNRNAMTKQKKRNDIIDIDDKINTRLPIFTEKTKILEEIEKNRVIIISGNTGCGKSTQVPQFIYENFKDSKILITQPRRIAAISIANRLSYERGTRLGGLIGYHVSMMPNFSMETKIFVKTTGIFLEELLHNNQLEYTHIIIDEVHERDLYVDLVLSLLKNFFKEMPNSKIKLILMSATIAESQFSDYLKDINLNNDNKKENIRIQIPIIRIQEKWHEVKIFNINDIIKNLLKSNSISDDLKEQIDKEKASCVSLCYEIPTYSESLFPVVAGIIERIDKTHNDSQSGILIFIPGYSEIQELQEYLVTYFINNLNFEFLILHSQVADDEQEKVFKYTEGKRKIILATNIAESSITISNIDFVIDFCLVKQTKFDENQNSSILELKWCSQASCQQRKGRTGRVNKGYYFRLITNELYNQLSEHQEPEILRTPLETPILKLKLYDEQQEPEVILSQTLNPPSLDVIINTIFRLEKMGALTNVFYHQKNANNDFEYKEITESNDVNKIKKIEKNSKIKYSSGNITYIGKIFADLPIDIKFSRLIVLSFALGQIDVGITLAAILSQERPLFLNSNKCNRISLYDSKKYYCDNQNCDFIASYTAYKLWCSKYKGEFINENIAFVTRLKKVNYNKYKEIQVYTKKNNLDLKVIKEILRVENDLKKRLSLKGLYSKYFESQGENNKPLNFKNNKTAFILKIVLAGTFYNQIMAPEYDDFIGVENDRSDDSKNKNQEELYTLRFNIPREEKDKLIEIFKAIISPGTIEKENYDDYSELVTIKLSDVESIKKILFITSATLRHNNEIPIFKYIDNNDKKGRYIDNREDKTEYIKLGKEPQFVYNVHYYDIYMGGEIFMDKDSINLTYVVPQYEELKKTKFVTDTYSKRGKNNIRKCARFTSLLPRVQMFDKYMMLIFGPKFDMIAARIKNSDQLSHYIGFQSYEATGPDYFDFGSNINNHSHMKNYIKTNFIKLDYLITNYHLKIINEIRQMINEIMNVKFIFSEENEDLNKKLFEELRKKYIDDTQNILKKIKSLIDEVKIRYINEKIYIDLYDYIQDFERKYKCNNKKDINNSLNSDENDESENEENGDIYYGYINEIKKLSEKVKEKDFLQLHDPLPIQGEFYFNQKKKIKMINKEKKITDIYYRYNNVLNRFKSLIFNKEAWLCCPECLSDICSIKQDTPRMTDSRVGEYILQFSFISSTLKTFEENKDIIKIEQKEKFEKNLRDNFIKYDKLFCCPSGETIIGYIRKNERYIYCGSNLNVRYPNLENNIEFIYEDEYKTRFSSIKEKVKKILKEKETEDFKKLICCKLCGFTVDKNVEEFKVHLTTKNHKAKMEELRKEFSY